MRVTTAASTITVTLPTAADNLDRILEIIKIDSGAGDITIDGEGAETINGRATIIDIGAQYHGVRIKCDGNNWYIVDWIQPYQKQYIEGNTYNSVALNITGTNWTTTKGILIPYQLIDGQWRLRFNIIGSLSVAATSTALTIAGVTLGPMISQAVTCNTTSGNVTNGYAVNSTNTIDCFTNYARTTYQISGDIEIDGKPTWCD